MEVKSDPFIFVQRTAALNDADGKELSRSTGSSSSNSVCRRPDFNNLLWHSCIFVCIKHIYAFVLHKVYICIVVLFMYIMCTTICK